VNFALVSLFLFLLLNKLLKKSFFSQTPSWADKSKILQACLGQTGVFLKNNKPKPLMA